MNIIGISTSDIGHGAGIAAFRLHESLCEAGHKSTLLVAKKYSTDEATIQILPQPASIFGRYSSKARCLVERITNRVLPQNIFSYASSRLLRRPELIGADLVHVHNIHWHDSHFSPIMLQQLAQTKPLVWTIHDMWPLTGHCYYSYNCDRWRQGCGACPDLSQYIPLSIDTTARLVKIKRDIIKKISRLVVVSPSTWLCSLAKQSVVFESVDVRCIPNGIDTQVFYPYPPQVMRAKYGIAPQRKTILFASAALQDRRKGFSLFVEAMCRARFYNENILLLVVGGGSIPEELTNRFEVKSFGYVSSSQQLAEIYSMSDLFVMPSLQDNLPSVVLESLACGTPVVCFNTGGLSDMVKHRVNGYLAALGDTMDLAVGMKFVLDSPCEVVLSLRTEAVSSVAKKYTIEKMLQGYLSLYEMLVMNEAHQSNQ